MLHNEFSSRLFRLTKCSFYLHNTTPYINPRIDSRIMSRFSDWYPGCSQNGDLVNTQLCLA